MKRSLMTNSLLFATMGLFAACGEKTQEKMDKVGDTIELQGRYQTESKNEISFQTQGIGCVVQEMAIDGSAITLKQTAFAETNCTGNPLGELRYEGDYKVGNELPTAPGARELDIGVAKVLVTAHSQNWLNILGVDAGGACHLGEIALGETREVTGLNCGVLGQMPAQGSTFYTSFLLNNGELHFTKLPHELPQNVAAPGAAKPERALDLSVIYHSK